MVLVEAVQLRLICVALMAVAVKFVGVVGGAGVCVVPLAVVEKELTFPAVSTACTW
jgi:hypothetical protein